MISLYIILIYMIFKYHIIEVLFSGGIGTQFFWIVFLKTGFANKLLFKRMSHVPRLISYIILK